MKPKEFRDTFAKGKGYKDWFNFMDLSVLEWSHDVDAMLDEMMEEYKSGKWNGL